MHVRIPKFRSRGCFFAALLSAVALAATPAAAGSLTVQLSGIKGAEGMLRCALFDAGEGFPMITENARATRSISGAAQLQQCLFEDLPAADYAIAVVHDQNANGKLDTNFFGIPKEGWGVSNNARPALRAPNFDEARFTLTGASHSIDVKINY